MTRDETKKLLFLFKALYPNFMNGSDDEKRLTIDAWAAVLRDYPYEQVERAALKFTQSENKGFAPSPGQVLSLIPKNEKPEAAAWSETYKALCNGIYHAEEEFKKLDPIIQRAIGSADILKSWAQVDAEDGLTVIQSQFLKAYRTECKRAQVNDLQIGENKNNLLESKKED